MAQDGDEYEETCTIQSSVPRPTQLHCWNLDTSDWTAAGAKPLLVQRELCPECLCALQVRVLKPSLQCDSIWRWNLWEVTRSSQGPGSVRVSVLSLTLNPAQSHVFRVGVAFKA